MFELTSAAHFLLALRVRRSHCARHLCKALALCGMLGRGGWVSLSKQPRLISHLAGRCSNSLRLPTFCLHCVCEGPIVQGTCAKHSHSSTHNSIICTKRAIPQSTEHTKPPEVCGSKPIVLLWKEHPENIEPR